MTKISFGQNIIENLVTSLNNSSNDFSGLNKNSFSSLGDNETLTSGINKIVNNINIIKERMSSASSIISRQSDSFTDGETQIVGMYKSISIPTELGNVYSPYDAEESSVSLSKKDGDGVSTDDTQKQELTLESKVDDQEQLYDLNDKSEKQVELIDEYSEKEAKLSDISNDKENNKKELNEYVESEEIQLEKMKKEANLVEKNLDDYKESSKEELKSIDSKETEKQEYDDNYKEKLTDNFKYVAGEKVAVNNDNGDTDIYDSDSKRATISTEEQEDYVVNKKSINKDDLDVTSEQLEEYLKKIGFNS